MSKVVMVTGGLGLVGSHVSRALVAAGWTPLVYDVRADTRMVADVVSSCVLAQGGLDDLPLLLGVIAQHQPAAILHFAAQVGASVERQPWTALNSNLLGTANVFEAARLSGIRRVVFASSRQIYGAIEDRHRHPTYALVTEDHPREPRDLYGKLKRATEDVAAHYAGLYGLDITALRFASSYGPPGPGRHKVILMRMIEAAIANEPFHVDTGADQRDHLCYSAEAANGALAALNAPLQPGRLRACNISSEELLSLAELLAILQEEFPGWEASAGPGLDYRKNGPNQYFALDTARARQELGFVPKFGFRAAVRDYAKVSRMISEFDAR